MYKHLTREQRYAIYLGLQKHETNKAIAQAIKVSESTVSREIKRNSTKNGKYVWIQADERAKRKKCRAPGNRAVKPEVRWQVEQLIKDEQATVSVDGATVTVSAPEEITEAGTYAISVPAGAFSTADGRTNEAFTTMFTITEPAGPADTFVYTSVVPADGSEVAELSSITVTYPQWVCDYINETPFNVVDAESNVVTTASLTYNDNWEDVVIVLEEPITAEGTYTITVPAGYIYSNEGYDPSAADKGVSNGAIYNPEFTLTYTVKAASEPINTFDYKSVDPANESVVKELGDITITFPANVANEVTKTPISVINTEDGSYVGRVTEKK